MYGIGCMYMYSVHMYGDGEALIFIGLALGVHSLISN